MKILLIRLHSLGDVLFNWLLITDIQRQYPSAVIDWVTEENLADFGHDTGPTHMAAALGRPTLAVHVNTSPEQSGVLGHARALNLGGIGTSPSVEQVIECLPKLLA
jgi:ADP-heptose:LPS heptosyltransferase